MILEASPSLKANVHVDRALVRGVALARSWAARLASGEVPSLKVLALGEGYCDHYAARLLPLALSSAAGAKAADVQEPGLGPAFPFHPRRDRQHLQAAIPHGLSVHPSPRSGAGPVGVCGCRGRRMKSGRGRGRLALRPANVSEPLCLALIGSLWVWRAFCDGAGWIVQERAC